MTIDNFRPSLNTVKLFMKHRYAEACWDAFAMLVWGVVSGAFLI